MRMPPLGSNVPTLDPGTAGNTVCVGLEVWPCYTSVSLEAGSEFKGHTPFPVFSLSAWVWGCGTLNWASHPACLLPYCPDAIQVTPYCCRTMSPRKPFLLQVALDMVFYNTATEKKLIHKSQSFTQSRAWHKSKHVQGGGEVGVNLFHLTTS